MWVETNKYIICLQTNPIDPIGSTDLHGNVVDHINCPVQLSHNFGIRMNQNPSKPSPSQLLVDKNYLLILGNHKDS